MTEVIISNPEEFEEKKKAIVEGGVNKLHVLADFDRTITYGTTAEGKRTETVISQLRSDPKYLSAEYAEEAHKLFDKYHPIEISADIPYGEKKKEMHAWWKKHFELLIKAGLSKQVIEQVINERPLRFREGSLEFISLLDSKDIPLVFMSAAPGDMLEEYLKKNHLLTKSVYVVSNKYDFDDSGKATKIREPIIHVLNKKEVSLKKYLIYDSLKKRKNVILMGDDLGDVGMAEGLEYDNIIKIGFLNEKVEERLELYKQNFDIVLLGDGGFDFPNGLLEEIIK